MTADPPTPGGPPADHGHPTAPPRDAPAEHLLETLDPELARVAGEERLRRALAAARQGLYDLNIQTGDSVVSPEYATMLGYDPATFRETKARWMAGMHPDDIERVGQAVRDYTAGLVPEYNVEFRQRTADGGWKWILSLGQVVAWDEAGRPLRMLGTHTDITERKEAELALQQLNQELEQRVEARTASLRRSEAHLLAAQRIAALGSWEFDIRSGAVSWSAEIFRIFERDPALGPPSFDELHDSLHPDDRAPHRETVAQALSASRPYEIELRVLRGDGPPRTIQARGEPVHDAAGQVIALLGTVLDITERKEADAAQREIRAQLEAANRELQAFAYSVSHDLRAPLRAVDGFSRALEEEYDSQLDDTARDYLWRIRGGVRRMGLLIDDLLRLSRVSRSEMRYSQVSLTALVEQVAAELRARQPERRVELEIERDVVVRADASLMRVALTNLVENAWKFTGERELARIAFGSSSADGQPVYFVRDNGAGFEMAYASKLFGVFQRLHDTNEFPGTGIGLATVQRVITRHGGSVWADGAVGRGATFFFTLPA